jgi:putative PIN family toxin of toxin-antitoxin system
MSDIRIVLDTNLIVSAALLPQSVPRQAFDKALAVGKILLSRAVLEEMDEVIRRPKFDKYVNESERIKFLATLTAEAVPVEIVEKIEVCRDPKDNKVLEPGVNGKADWIVTGDDDLLELSPFHNIPIITPRQFLDKETLDTE